MIIRFNISLDDLNKLIKKEYNLSEIYYNSAETPIHKYIEIEGLVNDKSKKKRFEK